MNTWLDALLELIYPSSCMGCGAYSEGTICPQCLSDLEALPPPLCACCGLPLGESGYQELRCEKCRRHPPSFCRVTALGGYSGVLRHLIHQFKFRRKSSLAGPLAELLAENWKRAERVDALVPVPLHPARQRARGYNQAELLARSLGRLTGVEIRGDLLIRSRLTGIQTELGGDERRLNVEGAFAPGRGWKRAARHIALVDDVMTTGATLEACAKVLLAQGASRVEALVLARVCL